MDPVVDPLWMASTQHPGVGTLTIDGKVVLLPRDGPVTVWRNEFATSVRCPTIVRVGDPVP